MDYGYDVESMALRDAIAARSAGGTANEIEVDSRFGWQRSPWQVAAGEQISLTARGEFQIAHDGQPWPAQPNGVTLEYHHGIPLGRLLVCILPTEENFESLEAPKPIEIGASSSFVAPQSGTFWFRLNDSPAKLSDNQGTVRVKLETDRAQRRSN
jgi:hypothetical protein